MQKSDCIIGVEHVSKYFGDKAVLNDVNLSVRKGEFCNNIGPLRLRQDYVVAPDSWFPDRLRRYHHHRRKRHHANTATPTSGEHRLSEVCPFPPPQRVQQHRFRTEAQKDARSHHWQESETSPPHGRYDGLRRP